MTALEIRTGQIVEEPDEILEEDTTKRFYQELYQTEKDMEEILDNMMRAVERIDKRLTTEDNIVLAEVPRHAVGIIDLQQTDFVAECNIINNILSLRLDHEWAQITGQHIIFVKLDFMKAYNRVAHEFLWNTLTAMGIGEHIHDVKDPRASSGRDIGSTLQWELHRGNYNRKGCTSRVPVGPSAFRNDDTTSDESTEGGGKRR
ncbi:hypothetical protein R1sor_022499 [Riccia sorocarpa]|uniref:Reverse transcriptase domain-containing protein n=1 Tax=Riccia sorocarpa TaxID=122646 RepID=A0ABD3GK09_9MARC